MRTRVKICGITRIDDALTVSEAGADAIGLVFYEKSPRFVNAEQAADISRSVPPFITRVALFKDAEPATVEQVLTTAGIDLLQFHGSEPPSYCEQFGLPYIKAIGLKGVHNIKDFLSSVQFQYHQAKGLLLDGHAPGEPGGSGERFDWSLLVKLDQPVILAGGLHPENVAEAVTIVRPYAVDVSSGVESAPGIKDPERVAAFVKNVIMADAKA